MKHANNHIISIAVVLLSFFLIEAQKSYAQISTQTTGNIDIERLIASDGLLSSGTMPIAQDDNGFMWFGTWGDGFGSWGDGLIRYDGYEYIHYTHDPTDSTTLSSNEVWALLVDSSGSIWVGTNNGLNRFDTETESFKRYYFEDSNTRSPGNDVRDILEDQMGQIWIGTFGGLRRYDYETDSFVRYAHDPDDLLSLGCDRVWELYEDQQGTLWIGTVGVESPSFTCKGGLNRFDPETESFQRYYYDSTPLDNGVFSLLEDSNGTFWVGALNFREDAYDGLFIFDRESDSFKRGNIDMSELSELNLSPDENPDQCTNFDCIGIYTIYEDSDRVLWFSVIGFITGVFSYDLKNESLSYYSRANSGLKDNHINRFFESNDETFWFSSLTGVYKATKSTNVFLELTASKGDSQRLQRSTVTAMIEDQNGRHWIGTYPNGLYISDPESEPDANLETYSVIDNEIKNRWIESLYEDSNGLIWVGGSGVDNESIIQQYDPESMQFTSLDTRTNVPTVSPPRSVEDIITDQNGRYWVASMRTFGLYFFKQEQDNVTFYRHSFADSTNFIAENARRLFKDSDGKIWIGSNNGLYQLIEGEELSTQKFLSDRLVVDLFEDSKGRFWVGTWGDGLHLFDRHTGRSTRYGREEGLSSDKVSGILEDDLGYIWISTSDGEPYVSIEGEISRLNPEDGSITIFGRQNGLPEVGFYSSSKLKTRDGKLFFGGNGGVVYFDPETIQEPSRVPPTMILTGLWIQNEKISPGKGSILNTTVSQADEIQLSHNQNDITLSYAGLSYRDPERTQYEYTMEGFDEEWIQAGTQRSIRYSGLPAGSYTFRARGLTSQGVWSLEDATFEITVLPPWWRTWWAYALYALLFAGGVFAVDRYQRRRLITRERNRAREREIEQQKAHSNEIQQAYQNLETAHENLKSAQEQLIQQEKLASLGQLTAGIAHEIKNPLNFVNNFSDVSIEMVDEAKDELTLIKALKSSAADKIAEEIAIILTDVEANLRKIHEHGSRADRIVKSMLQHSRGGEGERQPTDLNALIEEYVHLSYHGMRAGQKPIDCEIELDLDDSLEEIIINPEEMSRVIVNICNNAFDAMWQKANVNRDRGNEYSPILEVRTILEQSNVKIEVKDNGLGVPEKIRGNILQPFFTTKKGTEGTGLGLSISSNIIKAHGGEIHIESVEGKYTLFQIILPNVTSEV